MTTTITIANKKGGCGKTTTVVSLAAGLALKGYTVTVVDCDSQTNATETFGIDSEELPDDQWTVVDAYLGKKKADRLEMEFPDRLGGRLRVVPGSRGISVVGLRLDAEINELLVSEEISDLDADALKDAHRQRLKESVDALRGKRDFVIIDTPPEVGLPMTTALIAADYYLIPIVPSGYDLKGLKRLLRSVSQIRGRYQPKLALLGVLLCNIKKGTKLDGEIRDYLLSVFKPEDIFNTEIVNSVRHREAPLSGLSIHEHAPGEPASRQYLDLADEVLAKLGNPEPLELAVGPTPLTGAKVATDRKSVKDGGEPVTDAVAEG